MAKLDHAKRVLKYELLGLCLLVVGVITLGGLGAVGQALDDLCVMLAGNWHFLLPLYIVWVGLHIMIRRYRFRYTQLQIGIIILAFIVLTWSELDLFSLAITTYGQTNPDLLHLTQQGIASLTQSLHVLIVTPGGASLPPADAGGGMIGYALFAGMKYLFAVTGTLLVMIAAGLAALVLITRKSLVGMIERGSRYFEKRLDYGWSRTMKAIARMLQGAEGRSTDSGPTRRDRSSGERRKRVSRDEREDTPLVVLSEPALLEQTDTSGKRGSKRKRKRQQSDEWAGADADKMEQTSGALIDSRPGERETLFPFPDFGVPYDSDPPFEDFLIGADQISDDHVGRDFAQESTPSTQLLEDGLGTVSLDEDLGRVTLRRPVSAGQSLALNPASQSEVARVMLTDSEGGAHALLPTGTIAAPRPYRLPDPRILDRGSGRKSDTAAAQRDLQANAKKLQDTFSSFGVEVKVLGYSRGPAVTRYEIQPAVGVKVSRILSLSDDLALALAARDIRIEAPIPGKSAIGIEVPNKEIAIVHFREVVETEVFSEAKGLLSIALGKDIAGNTIVGDLSRMPHILVAGSTGSGKSVCINGIIASILFHARPDQVKFIMIDPKMVELGVYNGIPHLFAPVVTEARRAAAALRKVIVEMEHRYELFSNAKVRDLERYNAFAATHSKPILPLIVVIIDELADLMMVAPGDVETAICRLAQMARASGIHLVVATQRPSVDVITGLIKSNIPSRIAFAVSSGVDSRTILDSYGAEKLLGRGDMLYMPVGAAKPLRLQGAFLSETEVEKLVEFTRHQQEAEYLDDFSVITEEASNSGDDLDPLYEDAVKLVVESDQASTSFLQRKLKVGYARAARLVDSLEQMGIVGPFDNSKPREVYMTREQWLERQSSP